MQREIRYPVLTDFLRNNSGTKEKLYTVNCYNTTSTLLVNGGKAAIFLDEHMPKLNSYIANSLPGRASLLRSINKQMADSIKGWFSDGVKSQWTSDNICPPCGMSITPANGKSLSCGECHVTLHAGCVKGKGKGRIKNYKCTACVNGKKTLEDESDAPRVLPGEAPAMFSSGAMQATSQLIPLSSAALAIQHRSPPSHVALDRGHLLGAVSIIHSASEGACGAASDMITSSEMQVTTRQPLPSSVALDTQHKSHMSDAVSQVYSIAGVQDTPRQTVPPIEALDTQNKYSSTTAHTHTVQHTHPQYNSPITAHTRTVQQFEHQRTEALEWYPNMLLSHGASQSSHSTHTTYSGENRPLRSQVPTQNMPAQGISLPLVHNISQHNISPHTEPTPQQSMSTVLAGSSFSTIQGNHKHNETQESRAEPPVMSQDAIRTQMNTLDAKEKKIHAKEKLLDQKEKELSKKNSQVETSKACIIGLESRIKELEFTNRTLQQINSAMHGGGHSETARPVTGNSTQSAASSVTQETPISEARRCHSDHQTNHSCQSQPLMQAMLAVIQSLQQQIQNLSMQVTLNYHSLMASQQRYTQNQQQPLSGVTHAPNLPYSSPYPGYGVYGWGPAPPQVHLIPPPTYTTAMLGTANGLQQVPTQGNISPQYTWQGEYAMPQPTGNGVVDEAPRDCTGNAETTPRGPPLGTTPGPAINQNLTYEPPSGVLHRTEESRTGGRGEHLEPTPSGAVTQDSKHHGPRHSHRSVESQTTTSMDKQIDLGTHRETSHETCSIGLQSTPGDDQKPASKGRQMDQRPKKNRNRRNISVPKSEARTAYWKWTEHVNAYPRPPNLQQSGNSRALASGWLSNEVLQWDLGIETAPYCPEAVCATGSEAYPTGNLEATITLASTTDEHSKGKSESETVKQVLHPTRAEPEPSKKAYGSTNPAYPSESYVPLNPNNLTSQNFPSIRHALYTPILKTPPEQDQGSHE